jgi:hypothetical protein
MYSFYSFMTSALDGGEWSAPWFTPWERTPGTHCTGGWVGPRAGLDTEAKGKILLPLPRIEPRSSGHPVRSQTLYWLSYPGFYLYMCMYVFRSRSSSGSIVSVYGLDNRAIGVRSPAGAKDFSSSLCVQAGSEAHPASCTMGTGGSFPGGKARSGRDADHSPPSSAEVVIE